MATQQGTTVHSVELELTAVLQQFAKTLQQASQASQQHTKKIAQDIGGITDSSRLASNAVQSLRGMLVSLSAAVGAGFSFYALKAGIVDITTLAGRVEVLEVVSKNMGRTAGYTSTEVEKFVQQIKDLNITTQQANLSVTKFLQSDLPLDKLEAVAKVARDTGVIMGFSTQETLKGLVHGIITLQPEVLRTYGIITNLDLAYRAYAKSMGIAYDDIQQQTKQQIALNEVLKKGEAFLGTYETAMTKAFKRMTSLERIIEEFKVSMGRELQSSFSMFIMSLSKILEDGRTSERLKSFFATFSNGLNAVMKGLSSFIKLVSENPDLFARIFQIGVILSGTLAVAKLTSMLWGLVVALFSVKGAFFAATGVAVTLAILYGEKLPTVIKIIIGALGGAAIAFRAFALNAGMASSAALTLVGALGRFAVVFSVVSIALSAFSGLADGSERLSYEQEQLESAVYATRLEFNQLTQSSIDLAKSVVEIGSKTGITAQESETLWKNYKRLVELSPNYITATEDQTTAVENARKAIVDLNKELLTSMRVQNEFQLNQATSELNKLKFESGDIVDSSRVEKFRAFVSQAFSDVATTGSVSIEKMRDIDEEFTSLSASIREEIAKTSNEDIKKASHLQVEMDAVRGIFAQYSKLSTLMKTYNDLQVQRGKLMEGNLNVQKEDVKAGLSAEDEKRKNIALEHARTLLLRFQAKLATETREQRLATAKKDEEDLIQSLRKMRDAYAQGTPEYEALLELSKNFFEVRSAQIEVEYKLSDLAKEERNIRKTVNSEGDVGKFKLIAWYNEQIALLDTMGESAVDLKERFEAARDGLQGFLSEDNRKYAEDMKNKLKALRDEMYFLGKKFFAVMPEAFLQSMKATNLLLKGFVGTYSSFMDTISDLEITGKHRREAIWQDMLNIFAGIIDQMIRRWILFSLLTSGFGFGGLGLSAGVASGLLGIPISGVRSIGRNGTTVGQGEIVDALNRLRNPNMTHELSLGSDKLNSTVTIGGRDRRRSKL